MPKAHTFSPADILLPDADVIAKGTWPCIACDQFTSEPDYWADAAKQVGKDPSTLHLMLPEVYLAEAEVRLPAIHAAMHAAMRSLLRTHRDSMIALARVQSDGRVRKGLVGMIDLEAYDYTKGATSLIRATEGTVLSRIPARVAIRREAPLELPHVMLLIDDPNATVIEPLFTDAAQAESTPAYDCPLMLRGGHVTGRFLSRDQINAVQRALEALITPEEMAARYGDASLSPLLFAVGDGNHSLAAAKAAYEEIKAAVGSEVALSHPARYALCEVVNLHDRALDFEPIYRVAFGVDRKDLLSALKEHLAALNGHAEPQMIRCVWGADGQVMSADLCAEHPCQQLTVGTLQTFLDHYVAEHPGVEIDYIHGEDSLTALAKKDNTIGFLFDGMQKDQLFRTVIYDGALPRKTFSMGHARDKRYYMECRRIK